MPSLTPQQIKSDHGGYRPTKFESNPFIGLACTPGYNVLQGSARSHVALATFNWSVKKRFHRLFIAPARRINIRPSRSDRRKWLNNTILNIELNNIEDIQTDKHCPANFFPATHQRKSWDKSLQCSSIEALILYNFELEVGIAYRIVLCQNRRFFIFPALSGFEPTTPLQWPRQSCRHQSDSNSVLPAPIGTSVRAKRPKY